jgi:hypothetical protein
MTKDEAIISSASGSFEKTHPVARHPADQREYGWLVRVWVVVALFGGVATVRSFQVQVPFRDPGGAILVTKIESSLELFVLMVVVDTLWRAGDQRYSLRGLLATIRRQWTACRLVLAMSGLAAYHVVYFCYRNLKSWDVFNTLQDAMLLRWDRALFLGHSPAVVLHDLLGQHVAALALMAIYESFSTLVSISVVASLVFIRRIREGYIFITAAVWVWILGIVSYYLIPSLGPFSSAPQQFTGLPHTIVQDTQARYLDQRGHMLADPGASDAFAQVSAFASLHVAMTCMIFLMARYYRLRMATAVMALYLVGTILATVFLGWHYAVDDVAGLIIAMMAVRFARLMIYPQGRPSTSVEHRPSPVAG